MSLNIKDSGLFEQFSTGTYSIHSTAGVPSVVTDEPFTLSAERRKMIGENIPNFHKRKARGDLLPHTSFDQTEWVASCSPGTWNMQSKTNAQSYGSRTNWGGPAMTVPWRLQDGVSGVPGGPSADDMQYAHYAMQQAASRIYSQGFDALTFGAELKKTTRMFKGVVKRLRTLARDFNRNRLEQLWLEGRYGWRILAHDVKDLYEAHAEMDTKHRIYSERAGYSISENSPSTVIATGPDFTSTDFTLRQSWDMNCSIRGSVTGKISLARYQVDVIKTAWELTRFSFVIDFVYGVGVSIDTYNFMRAATSYSASVGYKAETTTTNTLSFTAKTGYTVGGSGPVYTYTGTREVRTPTSLSFKPRLTNRLLTPDIALDLQALSQLRARF